MRTLYCSIFLLLTTCITATCAEKAVTQDPNAGGAVASSPQTADERMAQKVTYQSGYKRLHNVTDELTTATDVKIFSGESSRNWQIRDIPLVVCVQDMPLGNLLNAIADTTHTSLTSSKPEGEERYYRLYRNRTAQKKIDDYFKEKERAHQLLAQWHWDVLVRVKDVPDSEFKSANVIPLKEAKLLSTAVAAQGPDARERFLTGEFLRIPGDTPVGAALIKEAHYGRWQMRPAEEKNQPYQAPTSEELAKITYSIQLQTQNVNAGSVNIKREIHSEKSTEWTFSAVSDMTRRAALLSNKGTFAECPVFEDLQSMVDAVPGPDYQKVSEYDPKSPQALQATIKIELSEDITDPTWADMVRAVAKASGYNIVVEDFRSHHQVLSSEAKGLINSETTIIKALSALCCDWMLDEKSRLLIGWGIKWQSAHADLVSESLLTNLRQKLEGSGVELDDIIPVAQLSHSQGSEWISNNKHLRPLSPDQFTDPDYGPLWMLYSMLDEPRQTKVKSDEGLPLASIDQAWLHNTLTTLRRQYESTCIKHGDTQGEQVREILSNPAVLRSLTMKIKKVPQAQRFEIIYGDGSISTRTVDLPPIANRHTYTIELTGEHDGAPVTITTSPLGLAFPIYSPARDKDILVSFREEK